MSYTEDALRMENEQLRKRVTDLEANETVLRKSHSVLWKQLQASNEAYGECAAREDALKERLATAGATIKGMLSAVDAERHSARFFTGNH